MKPLCLPVDTAAIACAVGVDPVLINVAVKDFTPVACAGKADAVTEAIEWRKVYHDDHVVAFAFHPAMKRKHAVLIMYMDHAETLAAQAGIAPAQLDQLSRKAHMIDHLLIA